MASDSDEAYTTNWLHPIGGWTGILAMTLAPIAVPAWYLWNVTELAWIVAACFLVSIIVMPIAEAKEGRSTRRQGAEALAGAGVAPLPGQYRNEWGDPHPLGNEGDE